MSELWKCALLCFVLLVSHASAQQATWIATWASSPQPVAPDPEEPLYKIEDQTVRERVRVSVGGARICLRFSNEYGSTPLLIGSVTVGVPVDAASVRPGSIQTVTFAGHNSTVIAAGAPALSDPVPFPVSDGAEISISIYFPKRVVTPTLHALALKHAAVSQHGDATHSEKIEAGVLSESSILINAVLVPAGPSPRGIVAFGDSITDGDGTTLDADRNWPNDLVRRLGKMPDAPKMAVVNEGIAGNRLLSDGVGISFRFGVSALARFDRDVLGLPGVTHIVLLEGINDIGFPGAKLNERYLVDATDVHSAEDLIDGYRQLIARAHAHGVKIIGATITPFEGVSLEGYYSEPKETIRQTVNKWIRTSDAFDGVIDFDAVLRDPEHPTRMLARFASADHLHPNDVGYQAMADAIDLSLFR